MESSVINNICRIIWKVLAVISHPAQQVPQQPSSQSFSETVYISPNGEVIKKSIYTDSSGNRIVDGENLKGKPEKSDESPVVILSRPDWDIENPKSKTKQRVDTGAYVQDDRGKWKAN